MRIFFVAIAAIMFIAVGCQNRGNNSAGITSGDQSASKLDTNELTTIEWLETSKDFGKITEGQKLEVSFPFKNTGNKPLVIYLVKPSCGCTLPEQPTEPIAPGKTGEIKATFNSEGKPGVQHKSIFVNASTKGTQEHTLYFQVEVIPATN